MRFACLCLGFLLALPLVQAQSTNSAASSSSNPGTGTVAGTAPTPPLQDPQAVSILNQVLTAAGGPQAIAAIADYTGTGNITYYPGQQVQGTVTVRGLGAWEFRIDASLPAGVRSLSIHNSILSTKSESGVISAQTFRTNIPSSDAFPYQTPFFPTAFGFPTNPLISILGNQLFGVSYVAATELDGHSVHDIRLQRFLPVTSNARAFPVQSRDIFIDTSTFQIVAIRETLPHHIPHEIHYSDFRNVNGVLMPFAISEHMAGQLVSSIALSQITFNAGLTPAAFALQ